MPIIKNKEEIINNKIGSPTGFDYKMGFKGLAPSNIILYSLFIILSIIYRGYLDKLLFTERGNKNDT